MRRSPGGRRRPDASALPGLAARSDKTRSWPAAFLKVLQPGPSPFAIVPALRAIRKLFRARSRLRESTVPSNRDPSPEFPEAGFWTASKVPKPGGFLGGICTALGAEFAVSAKAILRQRSEASLSQSLPTARTRVRNHTELYAGTYRNHWAQLVVGIRNHART